MLELDTKSCTARVRTSSRSWGLQALLLPSASCAVWQSLPSYRTSTLKICKKRLALAVHLVYTTGTWYYCVDAFGVDAPAPSALPGISPTVVETSTVNVRTPGFPQYGLTRAPPPPSLPYENTLLRLGAAFANFIGLKTSSTSSSSTGEWRVIRGNL